MANFMEKQHWKNTSCDKNQLLIHQSVVRNIQKEDFVFA